MFNAKIYLPSLLVAILLPFSASSSNTQMECLGKHLKQNEVYIKKTKGGFKFMSNGAKLVKVITAIRKESGLKIGIPKARQSEIITLCTPNKPMISILKSVLKTNYVLVFNSNENIVDVTVLQEGNEKNTHRPTASKFSGKVVVKGNVANMLHIPLTEKKEDVEQYIISRHLVLDELSKRYPDKIFFAQISFKNALSENQLLAALEGYDVRAINLNTIAGEYVGGNDVPEGTPLHDAINEANSTEMEFLNVHCMEENESKKASISEECKKLYASRNNEGTMFFGVQVSAKPRELKMIKDNSNYTRLVDPLWSGSIEDELSIEYKTKHTAIPLIPESKKGE